MKNKTRAIKAIISSILIIGIIATVITGFEYVKDNYTNAIPYIGIFLLVVLGSIIIYIFDSPND